MNRQELLEILLSTAADDALSKGERSAVRSLVHDANPSANVRDALAHDVIEHIAMRTTDPREAARLRWLGDTLRVLLGAPTSETSSRAWFGPEDPMVETLEAAVRAVHTRIDVAVFTITDDRLTEALIDQHRRGVAVRILTDNDKSHDRGSDAHRLERAGVPVRYDRSEHHFHHKFALLDGERLINGSYNWTRGADGSNRENFCITNDAILVRSYAEAFDRMWTELG